MFPSGRRSSLSESVELLVRVERAEQTSAGSVGHFGQIAGLLLQEGPGKPGKGHCFDVHRINAQSRSRAHVDGFARAFADALRKRAV